jgi:hypothetical protein
MMNLAPFRYFVHNSQASRRDDAYYARFVDECLSDGGTEDIFAWLMRRDISQWRPLAPPPETASRAAAIEAGVNPLVAYIAEHAASGQLARMIGAAKTGAQLKDALPNYEPFAMAAILDALSRTTMAAHSRNSTALSGALEDAGFVRRRSNKGRLWHWPEGLVRTSRFTGDGEEEDF